MWITFPIGLPSLSSIVGPLTLKGTTGKIKCAKDPVRYQFAIAGVFTDEGVARAVFEGVVRAVARAAYEFEGQRPQVTISLGYASAAPGENTSALLSRADKALYTAKRTGKNRTAGAAEAMLDAWLKAPASDAA